MRPESTEVVKIMYLSDLKSIYLFSFLFGAY